MLLLVVSESFEKLAYYSTGEIFLALAYALKFYYWILTLRSILNWFANINPYIQPWYALLSMTDPYFKLFEYWLPILFGIDLSYVLAFGTLEYMTKTLIEIGVSIKTYAINM